MRADAGWVDPEQLPKGPNGRALCRYCGTEVPRGRRSFCGDKCVEYFRIESDPGFCARKLEERDHGVCSLCGIDTIIERQKARKDPLWYIREAPNPQFAKRPPWPKDTGRRWWEDHHVVAVHDGGAGCPLDLHATVCVPCHKKVNKQQRHDWKHGKESEPDLFLPQSGGTASTDPEETGTF